MVAFRVKKSVKSAYEPSDSSFKLNAPSIKTFKTLGDRCFMIAAQKLWNALPKELREETNVDIFKRRLKTYLFKKHFNC